MRRLLFTVGILALFVLALAPQAWGGDLADGRPYAVGYRRTELRFTTPDGEERRRQLDLWYPTSAAERRHSYFGQVGFCAEEGPVAPGKFPLLVFSHGFLGRSDQSIFLTEACARAGYIVASMNHADALLQRQEKRRELPNFLDVARWDDNKHYDRREDVVALLDALEEWNVERDGAWEGRIDTGRIGGIGHSLGGYTMLGLAGGWKSWREPRLGAVVALSPYAHPYLEKRTLGSVQIPVMLQGGTLDFGITPFLPAVYRKLGGSKASLVLKNETHFGWTNLISLGKTTKECVSDGNAELIVDYTIAFFDRHLLGDDPKLLKGKNARLAAWESAP